MTDPTRPEPISVEEARARLRLAADAVSFPGLVADVLPWRRPWASAGVFLAAGILVGLSPTLQRLLATSSAAILSLAARTRR